MSMSRLGRLAGLVAAVAVLAGCGNVNPGVAVKAGDETVTVSDVDDTTADYCEAIQIQLKANQQVVPLRYFRSGIAGVLAQRSVAEQLAAEYDVEPGELYDEKVVQVEQSVRTLDAGVREAVVTIETAGTYIEGVQAAVGELLLGEEGTTGAQYSDQVARGRQAYEDWISENGVDVRPPVRDRHGQGKHRAGGHRRVVPRGRERQGRCGRAARPGLREVPAQRAQLRLTPTPMGEPAPGDRLLEFLEVMRRLRVECNWKAGQTHRSLARYLLEETHETLEAIDTGDQDHLREELGDLLLQVYFHAVIAEESGDFTIDDVAGDIIEKMHRRNPHVFAPPGGELTPGGDAETINEVWESIKAQEKQRDSVIEGLPPGLPALLYADKVLDRLQRSGRPRRRGLDKLDRRR